MFKRATRRAGVGGAAGGLGTVRSVASGCCVGSVVVVVAVVV